VQADTVLTIGDKPFTGQVEGSGDSTFVELGPLTKALGYRMDQVLGGWYVFHGPADPAAENRVPDSNQVWANGQRIDDHQTDDGRYMVSLHEFVQAFKLKAQVDGDHVAIQVEAPLAAANLDGSAAPGGPVLPFFQVEPDQCMEDFLKAHHRAFQKTPAKIVVGEFVFDTLAGRSNQPKDRGNIGQVLKVGQDNAGNPGAEINFGHGYMVGIMFSELSAVSVVPDLAMLGPRQTVEAFLAQNHCVWKRATNPIVVGGYVLDSVSNRPDVPATRGLIGQVFRIVDGTGGGKAANVNFGNGIWTTINLGELSTVRVVAPAR
jgi:hypothetical protein